MPVTGETSVCVCEWIWGQLLDSDWECRCLWPMVSATGVSAVSASATGANGVLAASHWDGNAVCSENQLLGGTSMSEEGEGLNTSIWTRTAGHRPCTWCLLLGG